MVRRSHPETGIDETFIGTGTGDAGDQYTGLDRFGRIVASNDDHGGSTDPRIEATLPEAGTYYLSLSDAHDQGGPAHVYRLVINSLK